LSAMEPVEDWLGELAAVTTAMMFTMVCAFTVIVVTMNEVMVAPPAIVKVGLGSDKTWGLSLVSVAVKPPAGAGGEKVTVTVAL